MRERKSAVPNCHRSTFSMPNSRISEQKKKKQQALTRVVLPYKVEPVEVDEVASNNPFWSCCFPMEGTMAHGTLVISSFAKFQRSASTFSNFFFICRDYIKLINIRYYIIALIFQYYRRTNLFSCSFRNQTCTDSCIIK